MPRASFSQMVLELILCKVRSNKDSTSCKLLDCWTQHFSSNLAHNPGNHSSQKTEEQLRSRRANKRHFQTVEPVREHTRNLAVMMEE